MEYRAFPTEIVAALWGLRGQGRDKYLRKGMVEASKSYAFFGDAGKQERNPGGRWSRER